MKIIDTVKQFGYAQWIRGFVSDILTSANLDAATTIITDMYNKRIYLMVDGREYMIRTKNFVPVKKDMNGMTCSEDVQYILYRGHQACEEIEDAIDLKEISSGILNIEWSNDAEILKSEYERYTALHGEPELLTEPQEGEYMMIHVEDLNHSSFDLKLDLRPLNPEELVAVTYYLVNGEYDEVLTTSKVVRYLKSVHQACVDGLVKFCCVDNGFDVKYTQHLIAACAAYKLCCVNCIAEEYSIVSRLYDEYISGDENALCYLKCNLDEFFMETQPYSIAII